MAWKLAPPAGGCAGPHHGCLSKSRMVISPRFMCHPMPSDRGPLLNRCSPGADPSLSLLACSIRHPPPICLELEAAMIDQADSWP